MNTVVKRFVLALLCVSLFAQTAHADTDTTSKTVGYGAYEVTIPSDFTQVGQTSVNIPLNTEVSGKLPHASIFSKVFTNGETILFVQRMLPPAANSHLRPVGGSKATKWGRAWRKNSYSMNVASTTREFTQYYNFIKGKGLPVTSDYLVEMYDHLVSPTSLIRVLAFTPKETVTLPAVPNATSLYTVENNS